MQDCLVTANYCKRIDITAFHANYINSHSKSGKQTVYSMIGDRPILSDELESVIKGNEMLAVFKAMFPEKESKSELWQ